jgi:hypothetical protein
MVVIREADEFALAALFSVLCGEENNCMSGIAMFIVGAPGSFKPARRPMICHN